MNPDFDIMSIQKHIQTSSMIEVKVAYDVMIVKVSECSKPAAGLQTYNDLLDILQLMPGRLYGSIELMSGLVLHTGENIR